MQRFVGIDFSGGVNAGRKIWIASGRAENKVLLIETCLPGEALPGSSCDRAVCLAALRAFICSIGAGLIGLDFPLGLPVELMAGQTWLQFMRTFADRFSTAQQFREACWRATRGRATRGRATHGRATHGREVKRRTDIEARTPFSPYNLRLYRQTYYGLRDVVAPLVRAQAVRVRPMQSSRAGRPSLIEICPASTLKWLNRYQPYKGRSLQQRAARLMILRALQEEGVQLAGQLKPIVLADPEGDALDSVLAAWAAFRSRDRIEHVPHDPLYRREGYVFV
ncbi:MAG TPA: DUF429 domain-containing protein [Anaerolineae bacterium]|nr:DUF429 domain-containing protein [Anaerolineae bacterium]